MSSGVSPGLTQAATCTAEQRLPNTDSTQTAHWCGINVPHIFTHSVGVELCTPSEWYMTSNKSTEESCRLATRRQALRSCLVATRL